MNQEQSGATNDGPTGKLNVPAVFVPGVAPVVQTVILTDLDDTLFQTARKMNRQELARSARATEALNGHHSFVTSRQQALFAWFGQHQVIPVTARGCEAFSRVLLPFSGPAVVANGATILDADGQLDTRWQAEVSKLLAVHRRVLDGLPGQIRSAAASCGVPVRTWLVEEPGCGGVYAVAKAENDATGAALLQLVPALEAVVPCGSGVADWRLHLNGNNLALLPPGISKAAATRYLLERLREKGEILTIGAGDSVSDLEFMRLCDLWITPTGSRVDECLAAVANAAGGSGQ